MCLTQGWGVGMEKSEVERFCVHKRTVIVLLVSSLRQCVMYPRRKINVPAVQVIVDLKNKCKKNPK